ncbi:MAG: thioesterase family protein [Desulfosarcina sp.]|nr:thioesterase family protein [Desulfobacterales bacterium]
MTTTLQEGMEFDFVYEVPANKTVPHLYPEFDEGRQMPDVFATGYMVGLFEFACIKFINAHIDWPRQQSVGIHINVSHTAATPPGFTVTVKGRLKKIDGRKLTFSLEAHDGADAISTGIHDRFIIDAEKFNVVVDRKKASLLREP